jgi:hypothetical protein
MGRSIIEIFCHARDEGVRYHELSVPWVIDGLMTRRVFEIYVETQMAAVDINPLGSTPLMAII